MGKKKNYLLEKVVEVVSRNNKGKVLDLGCGDGRTGKRLLDLGFSVEACDMDKERFKFHGEIPFMTVNLNRPLPYKDNSFDYVIFMEVIEHIYNPSFVISEIRRVLRRGGRLVLSTPNILNIGSRLRFFIEGSFDFFREPTLDFSKCFPSAIQNIHVIPWRYQELEYLLFQNNLSVVNFFTDKRKTNFYFLLLPIMYFQAKAKEKRAKRRGSVDFRRINSVLLSKDMLRGRHLILEAIAK
ncbi:MAG: methyltransferase domain-containing protein [Candidatus Omnitrophica bacterium]|nr:methyltransferase domain-containing protein [Candidatus Omnitrophota bacterium]